MSDDTPRYLSQLVDRELDGALQRKQRFMSFKDISPRLNRGLLRNLNVANIPASQPSNRTEWLNIVHAMDSIVVVTHLLENLRSTRVAIFDAYILGDTLSPIFEWLLYMHPHAHNCDAEATKAAISRYGWASPVWSSRFDIFICHFFVAMCCVPYGLDALIGLPESAISYIFDIWHIRTSRLAKDQAPDEHTATVIWALMRLYGKIDDKDRISSEIMSKGMPAIRTIIRRLRAVAAAPPNLNVEEAQYLVLVAACLLQQAPAVSLLRPLLWLISPLLRLVHHPQAMPHTANIGKNCETTPRLEVYANNVWHSLFYLLPELRGTRDIVRLIRGGLLQIAFDYLTRWVQLRDSVYEYSLSSLVSYIILPALMFPSVAKAVDDEVERHKLWLPDSDPAANLESHKKWRDMLTHLRMVTQEYLVYKSAVKSIRFCHNNSCLRSHDQHELKRCACGRVYYCSKSCQAADRHRHKAICQYIRIVTESYAFRIDRRSDVYFVRHFIEQIMCMREQARESDVEDSTGLRDFSSTVKISHPPEGSSGLLYVPVTIGWDRRITLIFPSPIL
ncbi:uncharacterized protein SCHCODRAFT_02692417 [Schizophyllum commune H4-8]|nr:uncharacterized protein SCHCODRAFT_02692417 [Schizophyllum commune H4-8]KAI5887810.1 hypothetical protein SCHCODRAFT_02692417 [Schizophyllum commune H4-8]